ncbi:MAG: sigma-54 dependent transcriptional regulator [Bacillota bacterium]|uniref:sigma-54-dependent transcriptional regulator n=1 Tax=Desulforudis sp. DRI-14 TaxID=3459793 RepID=UPI00349726CC
MVPNILIIDDEEHMCWALSKAMQQEGYRVTTATSGREGLDKLHQHGASLMIVDLKIPDMSGLDVLKAVKESYPKLPVIIITAHGTIQTAIEAMKAGASDYITKPFDLDELKIVVKKTLQVSRLLTEVSFLRSELTKSRGEMIGKSPAFQQVRLLVERVAPTGATVLLTGESGTGKEVAAVAIHQRSNRADGPFVAVNCAALPEQLLESELFGHERGAFTGANARRLGRFQLAHKGTIFLDEIGEMSPSMQAKLLRVLQDQTFERIGGTETFKVDTRIIAATNRNLEEAVKTGRFREDLYYRLNVVQIHLPPLRERKTDIPLLAQHFVTRFKSIYVSGVISEAAMQLLEDYHWPGNVRELQNVIERALILAQGEPIAPEHLPKELLRRETSTGPLKLEIPDEGISLEEVEKLLIIKALEKSNGNQTKAAALLKITRATLLYRMQKFGLQ